jgi:ABC-type branched-subunit amino acid transport system substrate-binding protein
MISNHLIKIVGLALLLLIACGLIYSQARANDAPPTIKIGLVAPFEGLYRSTGYEVLFAVKIALQERNQAQGLQGYRVELVALNDFNHPAEAARQAQALITDPDILGVVGHSTSASTLAALPVYQEAGLAMVVPWTVPTSIFQQDIQGVVTVAAIHEETVAPLESVGQELGLDRFLTLKLFLKMFRHFS